MEDVNPTPQPDKDKDVPTRGDLQKMISEYTQSYTYSQSQIDKKLRDQNDEIKSRMQDKADTAQIDKLQGIVMQLQAQVTTVTDTVRTLPDKIETLYKADNKRRSEMYQLQQETTNSQIASLLSAVERLISKTEKLDEQHDRLADRVGTVEVNDAEARAANALAWARLEVALFGNKEDEKDKGVVGKLDAIDERLQWVDSRRAVERMIGRVITSKWAWGAVGLLLGGGGGIAVLLELLT